MKIKLVELLKEETKELRFSDIILENNIQRINYYFDRFDTLVEGFIKLKNKYNFNNLLEWYEDFEEYPHIALVKSRTETTLSVCIDDGNHISPDDKELSPIIEDAIITYTEPKFKTEKDEVDYCEKDDEIHNKLFFTFLSLAWIKSKGDDCGVVVKTWENSSTESFFLNDLKWNDDSIFQDFSEEPIPIKNKYESTISVKELYKIVGKKWTE